MSLQILRDQARWEFGYRSAVWLEPAGWRPSVNGVPPRVSSVITDVAARHGVSAEDLLGNGKTARLVRPRQEAMHLLRQLQPTPSLTLIARWMANRNHATILHGIRAHAKRTAATP